jgi:hypothetical protein
MLAMSRSGTKSADMGLIVDRKQLCTALGASSSTVTGWERLGCPTERKGRGRGMKSLYDFDRVRAWLAETGRGSGLQALIRAGREPPATSTYVWTDRHRQALARAVALARLQWLKDRDMYYSDGALDECDVVDLGESFIECLARCFAEMDAGAGAALAALLIGRDDREHGLAEALAWAREAIPHFQSTTPSEKSS